MHVCCVILLRLLSQAHPGSKLVKMSTHLHTHVKSKINILPCSVFGKESTLSGREFTLDAAANDANGYAMSAEYCSPSKSFVSKQHSGYVWLHASFAKLSGLCPTLCCMQRAAA